MIQIGDEKNTYLSAFERLERGSGTGAGSWLAPLRRAAIARFAELGFPSTRQEAWKYTSVAPIVRTWFRIAGREEAQSAARRMDRSRLDPLVFGMREAPRLVFVNGHYAPVLSGPGDLPGGVKIGCLAEAIERDGDRLQRHLARHADRARHAFPALNTAFFADGALLCLPAGRILQTPIHLVFLCLPATPEPEVSYPRTLIVAGAGSQATIIESYVGRDGGAYLTNAVTDVVAGQDAHLDIYRIEREGPRAYHVGTTQVRLERNSSVTHHAIVLGGALVRHDLGALLEGEGASCTLNGLYVLGGQQHADNHTLIDHARPHGTSRELYKGVLGDRARAVFDGMVVVRRSAQKTDARQENRNLILSEGALVDTKPTLQIEADDVRCSHAATTGQLDEEPAFYLRSRGIDEQTARRILVRAFVSDVLDRIGVEPLRSGLGRLLFTERPDGPVMRGAPSPEAPA